MLMAYAVLVAVWCFVGRWLGNHPLVFGFVDRWGYQFVAVVFILNGGLHPLSMTLTAVGHVRR